MHGVIRSAEADGRERAGLVERVWQVVRPQRWFLLFVVAPTLVVAGYYYLVAADQYEASADFVVRRSEASGKGQLGLGQLLGMNFGMSQSQSEAYLIEEYLLSQNVVRELRQKDSLVDVFRRPGADFLSRLWWRDPTPESLLKYYRKHVEITQDAESGITHMRVRTFVPEDSLAITRRLLALGEARVNQLNQRNYADEIRASQQQVIAAEGNLVQAQSRLEQFRQKHGDLDPAASGKAQIGLVSGVSAQLVAARARLENVGRVVSHSSPQYQALASQVSALEAQAAGENRRLAGSGTSIASDLGGYEDLMVRKDFAAQRYTAAAAALQQAQAEAIRQQVYVTRIVDPELPVKSLFPERGKAVATVFFSLLLAYGIGWLLMAGVKEHAM